MTIKNCRCGRVIFVNHKGAVPQCQICFQEKLWTVKREIAVKKAKGAA